MNREFKKIKAIIFDIDGTLLPYYGKKLNLNVKNMISDLKRKGIICIAASGRDMVTIGNLLSDLSFDYFIGANGSFILNLNTKEFIFNDSISSSEFELLWKEKFVDALEQERITNIILSDKKNAFVTNKYRLIGHWFWNPVIHKVRDMKTNYKNVDVDHFHLITINSNDQKLVFEIQEWISKTNTNLSVQSKWKNGFFIANKNINKATSIKKLLNHLRIEKEDAIAFGDGENDIEMLSYIPNSVAMENAEFEVKNICQYKTGSVDNDGTYDFLKKIGII